MIKKKFNKINNEEVKLLSSEIVSEGGAVLSNLFNYSTDEQIIGTWINGEPVYRRVISKTLTKDYSENGYSCCFFRNIGNVAQIINLRAYVKKTNEQTIGTGTSNIDISFTTSSNGMVYFNWISSIDNTVIGQNGIVIIEYTKQ